MSAQLQQSQADRDPGLGLMFRLLFATSVVVAVVMLVEAVGQDWILVPAMAIHLALTYAVLHGIFLLLKGGTRAMLPMPRRTEDVMRERVIIVGGGVAGLETLLALRAL